MMRKKLKNQASQEDRNARRSRFSRWTKKAKTAAKHVVKAFDRHTHNGKVRSSKITDAEHGDDNTIAQDVQEVKNMREATEKAKQHMPVLSEHDAPANTELALDSHHVCPCS
jgi:hypothetical protein